MDAILVLLVVVLAAVAGARDAARLFDLLTGASPSPAVQQDGDDVVTSRVAA